MFGSVNWVLSGKKLGVRDFLVVYLQFLGGDFTSPGVRVRECTHEQYTEEDTAGNGGHTNRPREV